MPRYPLTLVLKEGQLRKRKKSKSRREKLRREYNGGIIIRLSVILVLCGKVFVIWQSKDYNNENMRSKLKAPKSVLYQSMCQARHGVVRAGVAPYGMS